MVLGCWCCAYCFGFLRGYLISVWVLLVFYVWLFIVYDSFVCFIVITLLVIDLVWVVSVVCFLVCGLGCVSF